MPSARARSWAWAATASGTRNCTRGEWVDPSVSDFPTRDQVASTRLGQSHLSKLFGIGLGESPALDRDHDIVEVDVVGFAYQSVDGNA